MRQNPGLTSAGRDEKFVAAMKELFQQGKRKRPAAVIESGTYQGTGTTAAIIEAIKAVHKRPHLVVEMFTIEPDAKNFEIAKQNLGAAKWCRVIHGSSVDLQAAEDFIKNDEMLLNPDDYPDVYVDAADPIPFYLAEVRGELFGGGKNIGAENVFAALLPELERRICLWVLDSAGGIGWLEFNTVLEMMGHRRYYVWLHDIAHVKHIRSYDWIRMHRDEWDIIAEKPGEWCLALHEKKEEDE